jgi:MFS superfamily sulfate permease-like transporter
VALISAVILLLMLQVPEKFSRILPAPLLVAVAGIGLSRFLDFDHEHMVAAHMATMVSGPKLLLNVPQNFKSMFQFPDFSAWNTLPFWRWSLTIAIVASLESLLSAVALDRIDPERRRTDLDRELWSKGICNTLLGVIGGLPIIAEIVRSTANLKNGAKGKWSNFFHGAFVLGFVLLFPFILHQIPLASLAAILVFVGIRLAHPGQIFHLAEIGKGHALAFLVTLGVTLAEDLLLGVFAGIVVELIFAIALGRSFGSIFRSELQTEDTPRGLILRVRGVAVFSNWAPLASALSRIEAGRKIILDFSHTRLVDHTVLEQLERLRLEGFDESRMEVVFHPEHRSISAYPTSGKVRRPGV